MVNSKRSVKSASVREVITEKIHLADLWALHK